MKKIATIAVAGVLALSLAACGGSSASSAAPRSLRPRCFYRSFRCRRRCL